MMFVGCAMRAIGQWMRFRRRWERFSRRFRRRVLRQGVVRGNDPLTPPRALPKTVWFFWAQGIEEAPPVVRACAASWAERNPGWTVRTLSMRDLDGLIEVADIPETLGLAHRADVFRARLLARYGGVWADATCYCMKPLDDWLLPLMQSGFFAFHRPAPDRLIDNWFLASEPDGLILRQWSARMTAYVRARRQADHYFWPLFLFAREARSGGFRRAWAATPKVSADGPLLIQRFFQRGLSPGDLGPGYDPRAVPVHKLSWKEGKVSSLEAMRAWGMLPAETGGVA